ncbi:phage tail spike protein [Pseudolactococcus reticulitermitis]|uniref:Tail spike domain-containing protein n=1 Tax=Pseudolactococcus reticulitermitis TaxID=2025039 RepID=A0A224XBM0_9LACT|nr:phage tail spike protein [Lactococcus reticulitermitis]GAX47322.1 hypothetical protein RsY01_921 [Lactococcus reticulitermitis]
MQFHILDENFSPVAIMDNDLPDAIHFRKSKFHRFLIGSADFLDFETSKLHTDSGMFRVGYWIAFEYNNRDNLLYITQIDEAERDKTMAISAISLNLDLNLEITPPFYADVARPFSWYFDRIMHDTGYEIGANEISNLTRKLSWDSEMSHRAFLQSVATQFDNAELDYEVQLNSDFSIKKRLVHIKKKVGEVREDIELRYGKNVRTIKRTTDISEICTAVCPTSKDDNDKVTTIANLANWQELDARGEVKFFHTKGENFIKAPQANARFGNRGNNVNGGGYIVYNFSHDKISQSELFNRAKTYLEEHSVPAINYEVEGRTGANIGDTVKIVDDGYTTQLILSARVLEQVISFDDATVEAATFGNYKALQSQISAELIAKMQQLAEENAPYKAVTLTTNGLTFKNSAGTTTLTARLYKGSKEIAPEKYEWTIDGASISGDGEQHEITADDIDSKAVVRWSAVINGNVVAFDEVTIIDVSDGVDGESPTITVNPDTSLTITDKDGEVTTPVLKGDDGVDGESPTITVNPDTSLTITGKDGEVTTPVLKGGDGTSGILLSDTPPEAPEIGQLWQDVSSEVQLIKKWNGDDWVIWELYVENLNANNLSAISPNLGTITGGSYLSWNYFANRNYDGEKYSGSINAIYLYNGELRTMRFTAESIDENTTLNSVVTSTFPDYIEGQSTNGGNIDSYAMNLQRQIDDGLAGYPDRLVGASFKDIITDMNSEYIYSKQYTSIDDHLYDVYTGTVRGYGYDSTFSIYAKDKLDLSSYSETSLSGRSSVYISSIGPVVIESSTILIGGATVGTSDIRTPRNDRPRIPVFNEIFNGKYTAMSNTEATLKQLGDLTNAKYLHLDLLCYNKTQHVVMDISNSQSNFDPKWKYSAQTVVPEFNVTSSGRFRLWEVELLCTGAVQGSQFRFGQTRFVSGGQNDWNVADDTNRSNIFVHRITVEY